MPCSVILEYTRSGLTSSALNTAVSRSSRFTQLNTIQTAKMKSFFTLATLVSAAFAKVILTNTQFNVAVGQPFTITWSDATGPVTLTLKDGESGNLQTVSTIASK